ncbi:SusD family outer membrane lipoprotein NanU [Bacteroides sp.]|uniref:SusD family outer membrane lipoprotein NanU n=1 Tax=Bacteroides sp. TaxID=29523 RepID=UPI002FC801D2
MKKLFTYILAGLSIVLFSRCDALDMEPVSSIADNSYWKSEAQFSTFNVGLHALLRECSFNFFLLGEPRADIYGDTPFGGEATQGMERLPYNTINKENVGISNFAGMYKVINQINLMIAKTNETSILPEASKKYYLAEAYGMRAYLYFHLLRSWGDVVLYLNYTSGSSLDLSNLAKPASPATEVMAQIKADVAASENAFGDDYSFKNGKHFWSKAATMMLKGEVYLWSGKQMNGGNTDYMIAKTALEDVKKANVSLLANFQKIFAYDNKRNAEIIFTIHNGKDEYSLWNDSYRQNMIPQQAYMTANYCNKEGVSFKNLPEGQLNGLIRLQIRYNLYNKAFRDGDTRKDATLAAVYRKETNGAVTYVAPYANKFKGVLIDGSSTRSFLDDYPIYRYADCLLLLAEAKVFLGEDPSSEINEVRKRAYGADYFEANKATLAYPNDKGDFYTDNKYMAGDENAMEAILKERMREFFFEGKRWYDLRLMGADYVTKYSSASAERLLWPINESTLTNNPALEQTPGY